MSSIGRFFHRPSIVLYCLSTPHSFKRVRECHVCLVAAGSVSLLAKAEQVWRFALAVTLSSSFNHFAASANSWVCVPAATMIGRDGSTASGATSLDELLDEEGLLLGAVSTRRVFADS